MPIPVVLPGPPTIPPTPPIPLPAGAGQPGFVSPDEEFTVTIRSVVDGSDVFLSGAAIAPYMVRPGLQGIDMPPVVIYADDLPFDDGSVERAVRFADRTIFLPIRVRGLSYTQMRAYTAALYEAIDPKRTLVDVVITQPDGSSRYARGRYAGGAEGDYSVDQFGIEWRVIGLSVRCFDPYFYAEDPLVLPFQVEGAGKPFLGEPFLPIRLGSSQIIGGPVVVNNPGDAEAFAVWEFTGPANGVTVDHFDLDRRFVLTQPIPAGTVVTVDTRPGTISVRDQAGNNLWASMSITEDDLFPLQRGNNTVQIVMAGATPASKAQLTMAPRYRAA